MNFIKFFFFIAGIVLFVGCNAPIPSAVEVKPSQHLVNYLQEVKPILDKRCVSCHSCYNSPCQAKYSSFEGVDRGASKTLVYDATRLSAIDPTRLFVDAKNTEEWREKGFYSLTQNTESNTSSNDSIMIHLLHDKKMNPDVIGEYDPEHDDLTCPKDKQELANYLDEKPNHGMPYGFPALTGKEYNTLVQWLQQGAKGPSISEQKKLTTPSSVAANEIKKWEGFLNNSDIKHQMSARYIYEHYYLAHLNFSSAPNEFYTLVRSKTKAPQDIDLVTTLRPFDDPEVKRVYYRFKRIHSTIVHKTHMVVDLDDKRLNRYKKLFISPKWEQKPHLMDYDVKTSANPFLAFAQIPVKSRYQFLLDNAHYTIMTFIRGPVCRGQMALNVIHDHFWVMFKDPEYDFAVQHPEFLLAQADNLTLPIEKVNKKILQVFSNTYRNKYMKYYIEKQKMYDKWFPEGNGVESIWKGNSPKDAPLLTVYRHYDSASVLRGVVGKEPRTMWVIDYAQLERIYYTLVAGYDVYGNVSHQTNVRRYMDYLRGEGEENFLMYMPREKRLEMFKSWYIGDSKVESLTHSVMGEQGTKIAYKTNDPKKEFIEKVVNAHILKSTKISFDTVNYFKANQVIPDMPKKFKNEKDLLQGARSLTAPGTGFISHVTDRGLNTILLKVEMKDGTHKVYTIVVNRWHDNVNSLFGEEGSLDPSKDTLDIVPGSVGSYPNVFAVVAYKDITDFMDLLKNAEKNEKYIKKFKKYFVSRSDDTFWETYDWFQSRFNQVDAKGAGLYDLNRYYRESW